MPNLKELVILVWLTAALLGLSIAIRANDRNDNSKLVTAYSDGEFSYSCSKEVRARYQKIKVPTGADIEAYGYVPINSGEARDYCRMVGVH